MLKRKIFEPDYGSKKIQKFYMAAVSQIVREKLSSQHDT